MVTTSSSPPDRGRRGWRLLLPATLGVGVAWLSLAVSVDHVLGSRAPAIAARWGLNGAGPMAARAAQLAQPGADPAALVQAESLASRALRRESVNVPAIRTLGQIAGLRDDLPRADRLFAYSEQLSRRDLLTQMWLIEERVRDDDVVGALVHYNRALKTVRQARPILFPVLVSAAADPVVTAALVPLMAERTAWGSDFLSVMAQAPTSSAPALGQLLVAARLRPNVAAEREALDAGLARLVASGEYRTALTVHHGAVGGERLASRVRGGDFETPPRLAPFDWSFADEAEISATREQVASGTSLVLRASGGRSGELARQLLVLEPGSYRLGVTSEGAGVDPITRASVVVACLDGDATLARLPLSATDSARLSMTFTVPPGCAAQALTIAAPAGLESGGAGVLVDDLTIDRIRA